MRFIAGLSDRLTSLMTFYRGSCRCRSVGNLECPRLPGASSPVRHVERCGAVASCGAGPLFQLHVSKHCKSRECMSFIASIVMKYFTFYFESHLQ